MGDQHFLDSVGMVDENRSEIQNADPRDVAIVARKFDEIFQRISIDRLKRPPFESLVGPGRKLLVRRTPHAKMLCPRARCVNAARVEGAQVSRARSARIRKPPRRKSTVTREKPAAVSLANADAGATGTNVLRMCATLCSQPF